MISPETIAAVKERIDIAALIGETVALKRAGRAFKGLCPFHQEKTPSFNVNPERGWFKCFGCGKSGGAIDFLIERDGLTFPEAVRALAERAGIEVVEVGQSGPEREQAERQRRGKEAFYRLMSLAAAWFVEQLSSHPLAAVGRAELDRRSLPWSSQDPLVRKALDGFFVGYAPYGWDGLSRHLQKNGLSLELADSLGLVKQRARGQGHYDLFRHRLMFAVVDRMGRICAFSGRALPEPPSELLRAARIEPMQAQRDERAPPKYVNSPETPIYVKSETVFGLYQARTAIRDGAEAVLVEGNFDVLSLHARGLATAVAPLGTAFTAAQAKLIRRYAPTAVLLFDGDAAGRKATVAARGPAREAGLALKVANLPQGCDPDDYCRLRGIEAVRRVVDAAQGMLEFLLDRAFEEVKSGSAEEIGACLRKVRRYLSEESDDDTRAMGKAVADRLAGKVLVNGRPLADMRALERVAGGVPSRDPRPCSSAGDGRPGSAAGDRSVENSVLGAILDFPELLGEADVRVALGAAEGDLALSVDAVRRMWDAKGSLAADEVLDLIPRPIHAFASDRLAAPKFGDRKEARAELLENAKKLRNRAMQADRAATLEQISRAQKLGDTATEDELLDQLMRSSKRKLGLS